MLLQIVSYEELCPCFYLNALCLYSQSVFCRFEIVLEIVGLAVGFFDLILGSSEIEHLSGDVRVGDVWFFGDWMDSPFSNPSSYFLHASHGELCATNFITLPAYATTSAPNRWHYAASLQESGHM